MNVWAHLPTEMMKGESGDSDADGTVWWERLRDWGGERLNEGRGRCEISICAHAKSASVRQPLSTTEPKGPEEKGSIQWTKFLGFV